MPSSRNRQGQFLRHLKDTLGIRCTSVLLLFFCFLGFVEILYQESGSGVDRVSHSCGIPFNYTSYSRLTVF